MDTGKYLVDFTLSLSCVKEGICELSSPQFFMFPNPQFSVFSNFPSTQVPNFPNFLISKFLKFSSSIFPNSQAPNFLSSKVPNFPNPKIPNSPIYKFLIPDFPSRATRTNLQILKIPSKVPRSKDQEAKVFSTSPVPNQGSVFPGRCF